MNIIRLYNEHMNIYSRLFIVWHLHESKTGKRLSYREFSGKTGTHLATISRLMQSDKPLVKIPGTSLAKACEFFGVTPGDILEVR